MSKRKRKVQGAARMPPTKNSGYSAGGGSTDRNVLKGWIPQRLSAKSDIVPSLDILRGRSADQSINTPIGAAAIKSSSLHAVGAGLKVFPRIRYKELGMTAEEARAWTRKTTREFDLWASSKEADITRRNNFYDMQDIAYTGYLTDGDSFVAFRRKPTTPNMPYTLRLQLLEANRISNPNTYGTSLYTVDMKAPDSDNRIIDGVEIDNDGAVISFWVSNKVPWDILDAEKQAEWTRVEAYGKNTMQPNILQVCHDIRPEQYRGVPYLAPVLETLKEVSRYTTAELTSAIIRSFFAIFFTESADNKNLDDILGSSFEDESNAPSVDVNEYALTAGTLNALPKGVDVKSIGANANASTFDTFISHLVKQIGAAIGQPYEVLMKNFTSSYSASRAALLQAWEEYKLRRIWFARDFCQPVYEKWLVEAIAIGRIEASGFFDDPAIRAAWCGAEWFGPTMSILDPVKDVNGSALRTTYALSTREREAAEMTGSDLEENLEQLAYEKKLIDSLGLPTAQPAVLSGMEGGDTDG
ncbi:MAG: phage portal protein [Candidatus Cloacimonetes bacterium]|nr:phage portal protein [Candidatus Cloacimonadota bacterium]